MIEPAAIILITDGGDFTNQTTITDRLSLPTLTHNSFTIEPFRWDQRVFSIILKFNSSSSSEISPLAAISEVTGGIIKEISNIKILYQFLEEISLKINQLGVNVNFEFDNQIVKTMLYVKQNSGTWPIPECYLPTHLIQPRPAQPLIYLQEVKDVYIIDKFPLDQYEIESCPLTKYVLENNSTFLTFINNSKGIPGSGDPFGFIKSKSNTVYLFILPYNFPKLFNLLDELVNVHKLIPSNFWRQQIESFLLSIPPYYISNLKQYLKMKYSINISIEDWKKVIKKRNPIIKEPEGETDKMDRYQLISQLSKMRVQLFGEKEEKMNNIPINEMGNFQEVLSKKEVLRNPFIDDEKVHKQSIQPIEEVEVENNYNQNDIFDKLPFHVKEKFKKRIKFLEIKEENKKLKQEILRDVKVNKKELNKDLLNKKRKYVKTFIETFQSYKRKKWIQEIKI